MLKINTNNTLCLNQTAIHICGVGRISS